MATALVEAGKATRDRILRAEAERLAVRQRLDRARQQRDQAIRLLNALRDQPADATVVLPQADRSSLPPPKPNAPPAAAPAAAAAPMPAAAPVKRLTRLEQLRLEKEQQGKK